MKVAEKGEKAVMSVVGLWDEISAVLLAIPDFNEVFFCFSRELPFVAVVSEGSML